MIDILSVENMRKSDAYTIEKYVPSKELMFRAGQGIFDVVKWKNPVAIICGSGNNAGDGYVIAKLLKDEGIECHIILVSEKFSEDGKHYFNICKEANIEAYVLLECKEDGLHTRKYGKSADAVNDKKVINLEKYGTIVDCLLGTGFKGSVRENMGEVIKAINASGSYIVSVDINSGLNGNTGLTDLCVESDLTVSVGGFQPGHFLGMAKDVMKNKINIDIGISPVDEPYKLFIKDDLKPYIEHRKNYSNKGTYGYVALIGGSEKYSGAIQLATMANAAMRSGAGVCKCCFPNSIKHDIVPRILESTAFPLSDEDGEVIFVKEEIDSIISNVKAVSFGMGIGTSNGAKEILIYLLNNYNGNLVVDADGLTLLSQLEEKNVINSKCNLILTPHIKEFSRLVKMEIKDILSNSIEIAREYADKMQVVLLLKGPTTIITDGKRVYLVDAGCAGMATAGSGDVLSGILSATCAIGDDLTMKTALGAYINGKAGELAQEKTNAVSMIASDTVSCIADVVGELLL